MKIWLDAGHGGEDSGASAFGVVEKDWTLDIDNRIAQILSYNNIKYSRTRVADHTVKPEIRAARIKNSKAKYCISSHINAGGGKGAETIHSIYSKKGERLAKVILEELGKIGLNTRKAYSKEGNNGDYYFMHRLTGNVTTIIVEYGFIDTKEDFEFLKKPNNRQKCAEAVVKALFKLEGITYKPMESDNDFPEEDDDNMDENNGDRNYLMIGDEGELVEELQKNLIKLGYSLRNYGIDGIFGEETKKAVMEFQGDYNLKVDGIAGPETSSKISEVLAEMDEETIYRIIVDGEQIGAYEEADNILKQIESYIGKAFRIIIEKVK